MKIFSKYKSLTRSNLFQYFYYFALISLLITVLLGGSIYFYASIALKNEIIKSNNNTLTQLKNAQEVMLAEVDKSFSAIIVDPNFIDFIDYYKNRENSNMLMVKAGQDRLANIVVLNEYIDSISIYYYKDGIVLSSNVGTEGIGTYYDRNFLEKIPTISKSKNFIKERSMFSYRKQENISVISLIKTIPIVFDDTPKAYVVINIKGEYLRKILDSIEVKQKSNIVITDKDGGIITKKTDSSPSLEEKEWKYLYNDISDRSGYSIKNINNEKSLISYDYSKEYSWRYFYIVPMSSVTSGISVLGMITVLLCIVIVFLSTIPSFFLSKKIYSPIRSILNIFTRDNNPEITEMHTGQGKETTMIEAKVNHLIDKNKNLEALLSEYDIYKKNRFLQDLIAGDVDIDSKLQEKLRYYQVDVEDQGYFMAYSISMDQYSEFVDQYSEKQKNMLFVFINENIAGRIFEQHKGFIVESNTNEIAIIINFKGEEAPDKVKISGFGIAKDLHKIITKHFKYTFTIGVSVPHRYLSSINECYKEASYALNYRLLLGYNNVIFYENIKTTGESSLQYPFAIEKELLNSLKVGDHESLMKSLDRFVEYVSNCPINELEFVRHFFLQLLSDSIKCLYEMDRSFDTVLPDQKDAYATLLREETIQGMVFRLKSLYEPVLQYSAKQRREKNKGLVDSVTRYIQDNLASDLTVEQLSDQFFISSSHLRKIFKDETGSTVKDFIDTQRMERAKILLRDSGVRISDISEKIGYLSVQAFTRAFKLEMGMTPGDYRAQQVMESKENGGEPL